MIHRESLRISISANGRSQSAPTFVLVEPSGGASGQATDISIHAKEILRIRELLTEMYAEHCEVAGETFQGAKDRFGTCANPSFLPLKFEAHAISRCPSHRAGPRTRSLYDCEGGVEFRYHRQDCGAPTCSDIERRRRRGKRQAVISRHTSPVVCHVATDM